MKISIIVIISFLVLPIYAQKVKTVEGEATYYVPDNETKEIAKGKVLEQAKLKALSNEFGTDITQELITISKIQDGKSSSDFHSISGSEVKGEWLETIGTPKYTTEYIDEQLVITCKVKGKAREIVSAGIDFKAKLLRNGKEDRCESKQFKNGDEFYLSFQSPVNGFLAVYLEGDDGLAYCLVPYSEQKEGIYPIDANKRYLFFDSKSAPEREKALVDECYMTTEQSSEQNQIYVIFSPNEFSKALDSDKIVKDELIRPRQLPREDFLRWLAKCRKHDTKMNAMRIGITIEK